MVEPVGQRDMSNKLWELKIFNAAKKKETLKI